MQKLSERLQAAADFVTQGSIAADIGTDHGFLPIYLVQSGRCPQVIAMDIRKGPLGRAKEHIAAAGLEAVIQTRLSDGMRELAEQEADSVILTGMGGLTVLHILEDAQHLLPGLQELVLEPQSDIAKVRRYLREHNMYIDREHLVQETGKFYPVLHVSGQETDLGLEERRNRQTIQENLLEQLRGHERVSRLLDQYGACMVYGRHPMLRLLLERDERRQSGILQSLQRGIQAADRKQNMQQAGMLSERKKEVERRLEEIQVLRKLIFNM